MELRGFEALTPYLCDGGVCGNLGLFSERANSSRGGTIAGIDCEAA